MTEQTPLDFIVHHPKFGIALKERCDSLGIECIVQYPERKGGKLIRHGENTAPITAVEFISRQFRKAASSTIKD